MKIHGMALLRNEASKNRWLKQFIVQMKLICDRVVILDDASTDETANICENMGLEVYRSRQSLWSVDELIQRKELWQRTIEKAEFNDWILCLDADELFCSEHINYIKYLFKSLEWFDVNGIAFRLFDMWNESQYRCDKWWSGHLRHWPMAIKVQKTEYEWLDKKLHCGRFPKNAAMKCIPTQVPIKHMGWSKPEFRQAKYDLYMKTDPQGKEGILEQYESILDDNANLINF